MSATTGWTIGLAALLTLTAAPAFAMPQDQHPQCIESRDVIRSHVRDDRTIDFLMRDKTVWRNTLDVKCPGLKTYGFVYRAPEMKICAKAGIVVLRLSSACMLGQFSRVPGPADF